MAAPTGFSRLSPLAARLVLAVMLLAIVFCVGVTLSPLKSGYADAPPRGPGDVQLYRAEVDRIAAGQDYYLAAATELRSRGYPTRSIFNWRTPLPMWLIGVMPDPVCGKVLLGLLALAALAMTFTAVERDHGVTTAWGAAVLMTGALLPCVLGDLFVMPELWAGVLIAISLAAFGLNRPLAGVAAGVAALFCRELVAPYCVLGWFWAVRSRDWRLSTAWVAGLAAYGMFFVWHMSQVAPLVRPQDIAHEHGWVRFGATAFVISLVQMNAYLLVLPQWVSALVLPLSLLGFAAGNSQFAQRAGLTASFYVLLFGVVGQPFNQYWGSLVAPLLCLGLAQSPAALRDLWQAAKPTQAELVPDNSLYATRD